jgi:hypothetical protein
LERKSDTTYQWLSEPGPDNRERNVIVRGIERVIGTIHDYEHPYRSESYRQGVKSPLIEVRLQVFRSTQSHYEDLKGSDRFASTCIVSMARNPATDPQN